MGTQGFDQRAQERASSLIGQVIDGRYKIDRILAMGGMGTVYLARHLKLRKRVALKVLHPGTEDHPELFLRFEREALAGAQVSHPHVAAATDFGELSDGTRFLVLEYVRGVTLRAVLDREAPLAVDRAGKIVRQIAVALGEIHARGIVHRDLKPRNVMLAEGDFVKLVDFGLARIDGRRISTLSSDEITDEERLTGGGTIFGTIEYLAPEAAFGMDLVDSRADLYALGVMFYEMLAGKHPFEARTEAELFAKQRLKPPPPIAERAPGTSVDPLVEGIVMKLLEKDFDERYQAANELIAAIDGAIPEARVVPAEPAPPTSEALFKSGDHAALRSSFPPPLPTSTGAKASDQPPARQPSADDPPNTLRSRPPHTPASSAPPGKSSSAPPRKESSRPPPALSSAPPPRASAAASRSRAPSAAGSSAVLWVGLGVVLAVGGYLLFMSSSGGPAAPPTQASTPAPPATMATATASFSAPSQTSSAVLPAPSSSAIMPSSAPSAVKSPPVTSAGPVAEADVSALRAALKANQTDAARTQAVSLLQSNAGALENEAVRKLVRKLLVTLVQEKHPAAAETFELVGSSQGSRGPDLLYDLLEGSGRAAWADLAASTLAKPAVVAHSSVAMSLALKLRTLPCDDKLALVDQAVESGDERAVVAMQIVVRGCVRDTRRVDGAIRRLKDRLQKG